LKAAEKKKSVAEKNPETATLTGKKRKRDVNMAGCSDALTNNSSVLEPGGQFME
jgi:hypothetical protein